MNPRLKQLQARPLVSVTSSHAQVLSDAIALAAKTWSTQSLHLFPTSGLSSSSSLAQLAHLIEHVAICEPLQRDRMRKRMKRLTTSPTHPNTESLLVSETPLPSARRFFFHTL